MVELHMIAIGELIKYPAHPPRQASPNRGPVLLQLQSFQARKGGREPGSVNEHEVARTFQCAVPGFSFALTMASASLPYSSSK
ncbi:hypothetical protein GCM10007919_21760 [Rhizobium indigoferae]|nr:hypothetical protein GCM10007919_21760 [Rhizobium indigoferae]